MSEQRPETPRSGTWVTTWSYRDVLGGLAYICGGVAAIVFSYQVHGTARDLLQLLGLLLFAPFVLLVLFILLFGAGRYVIGPQAHWYDPGALVVVSLLLGALLGTDASASGGAAFAPDVVLAAIGVGLRVSSPSTRRHRLGYAAVLVGLGAAASSVAILST